MHQPGFSKLPTKLREPAQMHNLFYLIGLVVVVLAILNFIA
jgi:hypothetical protein